MGATFEGSESEPKMSVSTPRRRILIAFAHPAFERSRVNRSLAGAVRELPGVTFHDLYEAYPDFDINIQHEQELLLQHDVLVLQHPFYWYSTPALVKQWEDLVLEHGWAYGAKGTALVGKIALSVLSTGGREEAYRREGRNRYTMRELLVPIAQSFALCGMEYLPPFVAHGAHGMTEEVLARHTNDYRRVIEALRDDTLDLSAARQQPRLNWDLDLVIRGESEGS